MPGPRPTTPARPAQGRIHDRLISLLGWLLLAAGVLLLPMAGITLLMLIARSYGTAGATAGGVLLIVGGPPAAVAAGIGLVRRWRWAHPAVTLAAIAVAGVNLVGAFRGPTEGSSQVLPSGTRVTTSPSGPRGSGAVAMAAAAVAAWMLTPAVRSRFRGTGRGFDARKDLPPPGRSGPAPESSRPTAPRRHVPTPHPAAIPVVLISLLAASGFFFWLAAHGVSSGKIPLPSRRGVPGHKVERAASPALFWTAVGFHSLAGTGCLGLSGWILRAVLRPSSRR